MKEENRAGKIVGEKRRKPMLRQSKGFFGNRGDVIRGCFVVNFFGCTQAYTDKHL